MSNGANAPQVPKTCSNSTVFIRFYLNVKMAFLTLSTIANLSGKVENFINQLDLYNASIL